MAGLLWIPSQLRFGLAVPLNPAVRWPMPQELRPSCLDDRWRPATPTACPGPPWD